MFPKGLHESLNGHFMSSAWGTEPSPVTLQENTRVCYIRIHKIEEAAHPVLRVLKRAVPNFHRDIAVVNAGLHYGVGDPAYR